MDFERFADRVVRFFAAEIDEDRPLPMEWYLQFRNYSIIGPFIL